MRKFYEDRWYFSLLDIFSLARIIQPILFLNRVKLIPDTEEIFKNHVKTFTFTPKNAEIQEHVETITYEGFMELLPFMRSDEAHFPGPLPEWLQNMSQIEYTYVN